jgi:hypothetical protein
MFIMRQIIVDCDSDLFFFNFIFIGQINEQLKHIYLKKIKDKRLKWNP